MKVTKKLLAAFIFACASVSLSFADRTDPTEQWYYAYKGDHIVITGAAKRAAEVEIPSIIEGIAVTEIAQGAFRDNNSIEVVTIPDSVTKIGSEAFRHCSRLRIISLPDSITELGIKVFRDCRSLSQVKLSRSLTEIPEDTFYDCDNLESIVIPTGVRVIGEYAFGDCDFLRTVILPESLEDIGDSSFYGTAIEEIALPSSLRRIDTDAFYSCHSLRQVIIPDSVRWVSDGAFTHCRSLREATIARPTHIAPKAFDPTVLLFVYKDSQAAKVADNGGYEYKFRPRGSIGDYSDYTDAEYSFWGAGAFTKSITAYDEEEEDDLFDENDDEDAFWENFLQRLSEEDEDDEGSAVEPITADRLKALIETLVERENTNAFETLGSEGEEGIYHVYFEDENTSAGVDIDSDIPYIYYLLPGEGDVPNLLYVVYAKGTSYNNYLFNMVGDSMLEDESAQDMLGDETIASRYEEIQTYTISYRTQVTIRGIVYEVFCTDLDED